MSLDCRRGPTSGRPEPEGLFSLERLRRLDSWPREMAGSCSGAKSFVARCFFIHGDGMDGEREGR